MSTRTERDRQKAAQEKHQMVLNQLLKDEDNKYCVDCDAKGPRWASWNLGIFLCIRCAGIHRNLGVHISKVKSVNLDTWTPEQIAMMQEMGNSRARAVYEANLPDNYRRPQSDSALEAFIRAKYEAKKYIAHEWVPPQPKPTPIFEEMPKREKKKAKPKTDTSLKLNAPPGSHAKSNTDSDFSSSSNSNSKVASKSSENQAQIIDLFSLDDPPPVSNSNDIFGDFISNTAVSSSSTNTASQQLQSEGSREHNLDNPFGINGFVSGQQQVTDSSQVANTTNSESTAEPNDLSLLGEGTSGEQKKSKESILALYGNSTNTPSQQMYPGGVYMNQTNMSGMMPTGVPQQTQPVYNGMMQMPQQNGGVSYMQSGLMQQNSNQMIQQGAGGMNSGMMGSNMGMMGAVPNMYNPQSMNTQNMYTHQLQNQMSAMSLGGGNSGMMGMPYQQPQMAPVGGANMAQTAMNVGWNPSMQQTHGNTLSNTLWQ